MVFMGLLSLIAGSAVTLNQDHTSPSLNEWRSTDHEASAFIATSATADVQTPSVAAVRVDDTTQGATTPRRGLHFAASTMSTNATAMRTTIEPQSEDTSPPSSMVPNQNSDPSSAASWMPTSSDQTQSTKLNVESTTDNQTPTSPSQSTEFFSTPPMQTEPVKDESTTTNPSVTADDSAKTSPFTTKKMIVLATEVKKQKNPPQDNSKKSDTPGIIVASIIGGALAMMIIGFIVIFIRSKKYKQQQVQTKDWAGPSPFLENNTNNGHVSLTSSNRISFSSILPQRLSRKLSLLPEEDQELDDIMTGTTFGGKKEAQFLATDQAEKESNGTAAAAAEEVEIEGNAVGSSSQANEAQAADKNSEVTIQNKDDPATPLPTSGPADDSSV